MSDMGHLDLRFPIGMLFVVLGLLLAGYGAATHGDAELYARSLSLNINLWWGLVMLGVGAIMLFFGLRGRRREERTAKGAES